MNFITFGGPTEKYHKRVNEICKQAMGNGKVTPFTKVIGFTEKELKSDTPFWSKHGRFIESNPRGYGYWLWKPYLIKKTLDSMNVNEILIYVDAGCTINFNPSSLKRLEEYTEMVRRSSFGILSFQMSHLAEFKYSKYHTIHNVLNDIEGEVERMNDIISKGQCMATVVILCKKAHSVNLVNQWWKYAQMYSLIDDTHKGGDYPEFIDHRHDQSIYSLLVKKHGTVLVEDETFFHPRWEANGDKYPFWATRIK
jgi:hypothetical protein